MKLNILMTSAILLVGSALPATGTTVTAASVVPPACGGHVLGVATCTFQCAAGPSDVVVSFVGSGTVSATCLGSVVAECSTGAAGACVEWALVPCNCAPIGICTGEGVGVFECSIAYLLPEE